MIKEEHPPTHQSVIEEILTKLNLKTSIYMINCSRLITSELTNQRIIFG